MDRTKSIGGSDATRIMRGDWLSLYMEKVGLKEQEDLSRNFKVQLGILTEPLHRQFFEYETGFDLTRVQDKQVHWQNPWMTCHLDGFVEEENMVVEFKHTSAYGNMQEKMHYYMAQIQHSIEVTGADGAYLSCIFGNDAPRWSWVNKNEEYIKALVKMEKAFWWHVENKVPPEDRLPDSELTKIAKEIPIDGMRSVDMSESNSWSSQAIDWLETLEAKQTNEAAAKEIKALVPDDAAEAYGSGIIVRRDRRGRLSLRKEKEK